jgi:hypothetical protein
MTKTVPESAQYLRKRAEYIDSEFGKGTSVMVSLSVQMRTGCPRSQEKFD